MPTLNDVLAGSQAQAVQVQQIIDALKGTPNKGVPVALVSLNDANNYALTVQNDDPVNSRALSVLKADGTTLISADATGVTLGAPVNVPPGSISGTAIAAGSITNAMLGADVARDNLLVNGGFEIWQRGAGPFTASGSWSADRWMVAPVGTMSVSRDTANAAQSGGTCAAIVATGGPTNLLVSYLIPNTTEGQEFRGRTYSLSARVKCSVANGCRLSLFDSTGATALGAYHTGGGAYETLTVTGTAGATSSQFQARVVFDVAGTYYVDNAMLVVGSQAANYVPMHPADDLARCLRYYEIMGVPASSDIAVGAYQAAGVNLIVPLFWKAIKPVTPTVTKVGTWGTTNCAQPTVPGASTNGCELASVVTALGPATFSNSAASTSITVESNP